MRHKNQDGCIATEADTDDPEELEILQRLWYYLPPPMLVSGSMSMQGLSSWDTEPGQWYRYNGKERDTLSGWTDFGARWGILEIGRFSGVDRFAIKFSGLSPYSHAGNNPISFIDINGDSLDVSHLMTNNRAASDDLISSLEHNSGYDLSVDEKTGNVSIIGRLHGANGKKIKGSKLARSVLENLISDTETTVRVLNDPGSGTRVINHENIIRYDSRQMDFLANFTSNDLNKETFGPALNFFHELGHTAYGGSLADPGGKEAYTTSGEIEVIPNKIRKQLGRDYGQRMAYRHSVLTTKYGDINYMPFSKKSLSRIKAGLVPESQYHGGF